MNEVIHSLVELRREFVRLLTVDSPHHDRRKSDFNQAIFDAKEGWPCFTRTDLEMVLEKFDRAVKNVLFKKHARIVSRGIRAKAGGRGAGEGGKGRRGAKEREKQGIRAAARERECQ